MRNPVPASVAEYPASSVAASAESAEWSAFEIAVAFASGAEAEARSE